MYEKERIQHQLQQLQKECITEYLQNKLEAIATKQVINDILSGFMTINKEEFIQNITQTILEVKTENKNLRQEQQSLKKSNYSQLKSIEAQLIQSEKNNETKYNEMCLYYQEMIANLKLKQRANEEILSSTIFENQSLKLNIKQIQKKLTFKQKMYIQLQNNEKIERQKNEQLKLQFERLKEQIQKLKQQNIRQIYELTIKKEREIAQIIEEKNKQNKSFEKNIEEIKQSNVQNQKSMKIDFQTEINELKNLLSLKTQKQKIEQNQITLLKQNEQLQIQIGRNYEKILNLKNENQVLQLGLKYYKEEDSYLRQQLLLFDSRYQQLKQKHQQNQLKFNTCKQQLNQQITRLNLMKLNQNQQYKQELANMKCSFQVQNQYLGRSLLNKTDQAKENAQKLQMQEQKNKKLLQQISICKEQLKCLNQQTNMFHTQIQMNLTEIQFHKNQLQRVNQQCRFQIQTCKQTYQCNWNSLNEQMIELKYNLTLLQNQNQQLSQELVIYKEKQRFYCLYVQQISQLKSQIQLLKFPINSSQHKHSYELGNVKSKFYYFIFKIKQEIKLLKKQNKELRQYLIKEVVEYNRQINQIIPFIAQKLKQEYRRCIYCQHQKNYKTESRHISNVPIKFQKTMPKVSSKQSGNFTNIKKTLKSIQQRYQIINEQNKYYNQHIEAIMKRN